MAELSLKQRLYNFLKHNAPNWVASGEIQRIVMQKTQYLGPTVARRLRELEDAGSIEVEYRARHHAWYKWKDVKNDPVFEAEVEEPKQTALC